MANQTRFVVLEDHPLVRRALVENLISHMGDIALVYSGASVSDAVQAINEQGADCIVLDLDLGDGRTPVENVQDLVETSGPVLIVSALADSANVRASLTAGASGFVSKTAEAHQFVDAVDATLGGGHYMSPDTASIILAAPESSVQLSDRERMAMSLYASGMKMSAVARRMDVSIGTAQEYIKRVRMKYAKSGNPLPTKTQLYQQARSEGLLP